MCDTCWERESQARLLSRYCVIKAVFELCRRLYRTSLTFHPVGGSIFDLWPFFLLRDKGEPKEMTGTQHVGTLKHQFLYYMTIKIVLLLFYYQQIIKLSSCFLHLCYLVATSTGSKSQLFQRWRE
jgi:hypothetical protein